MSNSNAAENDRSSRWNRREVLQVATTAGISLLAPAAASARDHADRAKRCIFIVCTGGPSQLETWDPKPEAPSHVRGPFGAIETNISGIRISETLPRLARLADRYSLVRSLHSNGPALHEIGLQLIQTGACELGGEERPHVGAAVAQARGGSVPVLLPHPIGDTGLPLYRGQGSGFLTESYSPISATNEPASLAPTVRAALSLAKEPAAVRDRYGRTPFGENCLRARRLVENGAAFVTINQFDTIFHQHTWDCHGLPDLPTRVADLRDHVAAPFDLALSALIEDLYDRGLYEETLVVCVGEFGRTPRINKTGGRDHWNRCWSAMLGGGGTPGGQVIGASDAHAAEPTADPITPTQFLATIYEKLGLSPDHRLRTAAGTFKPLLPAGSTAIPHLA